MKHIFQDHTLLTWHTPHVEACHGASLLHSQWCKLPWPAVISCTFQENHWSTAAITERLCIWGAEPDKKQANLESTRHMSVTLHIELLAWRSAQRFFWDFCVSSMLRASKILKQWEPLICFLLLLSYCIFVSVRQTRCARCTQVLRVYLLRTVWILYFPNQAGIIQYVRRE